MRTTMLLSTLVIIGSLTLAADAAGRGANGKKGPGVQPPAVTPLTDVEAADILHMRQEEKLARDVYLSFAQMYGCAVFSNIAAAEQRHMDAMGLLVIKYRLKDPVVDDTPGEFTSTEFTAAYEAFLAAGAGSLLGALNVGVQIEELDIDDLTLALENTDKSDIEWVYENLMAASNNHLAAFNRNIASGGTGCVYQNAGGMRNGQAARADTVASRGRGRGGKGNGGKGNGGGNGQGDRQRRRDGSCLPIPTV